MTSDDLSQLERNDGPQTTPQEFGQHPPWTPHSGQKRLYATVPHQSGAVDVLPADRFVLIFSHQQEAGFAPLADWVETAVAQ